MAFEKGHKKIAGKKKGTKNKSTALFEFKGITEEDKRTIFLEAMKLVKKGNVTIINKFLDKMFANATPIISTDDYKEPPDFENMTDEQLDDFIAKNR